MSHVKEAELRIHPDDYGRHPVHLPLNTRIQLDFTAEAGTGKLYVDGKHVETIPLSDETPES